jgi:hypothetical protein
MSGWTHQVTEDGKPYWFNHVTNQSSWADPNSDPTAVVHTHTDEVGDSGHASSGWVDEGAVVERSGGGGSIELVARGGAASKLGDMEDDADGETVRAVNFSSIARRSIIGGRGAPGAATAMEAHSVEINRVLVSIHFKQEMKGSRDDRMRGRLFLIEINQSFHQAKMKLFRMQSIILSIIMMVLVFPVAVYYLVSDYWFPADDPHFCLGYATLSDKCASGVKIPQLVIFLLIAFVALPGLCIAYVVVATGFFGREELYLEKMQRSAIGRTLSICWLLALTACMLAITFLSTGGWGLLTLFYIATCVCRPAPVVVVCVCVGGGGCAGPARPPPCRCHLLPPPPPLQPCLATVLTPLRPPLPTAATPSFLSQSSTYTTTRSSRSSRTPR